MKKMKRSKPYYSISAVAKMFAIHQQTIRLYEKEGLLNPKRSKGNTRMFTEDDVTQLEEIIHLTHQLGINLAGVQMVLKLQKQIKRMQREMNKLFDTAHEELEHKAQSSKKAIESSVQQLAQMKQKTHPQLPGQTAGKSEPEPGEPDWQIDYEE